MNNIFTPANVDRNFFTDSVNAKDRGQAVSVSEMYPNVAKRLVKDARLHDANFAFYTTALQKLHTVMYEPKWFVTYTQDVPIDVGGGFVDYVTYYSVDWAGIMTDMRNIVGNDANYVPRVNAGLSRKQIPVFTWEVAYDLRFIELEKMKKIDLQKSIQEIYQNAIMAGWDFFVQKIAYLGSGTSYGLFNSPNVGVHVIPVPDEAREGDNASNIGTEGMTDAQVVSLFNGIFETYLKGSNMNLSILPDTILVPTYVGKDLSDRFSPLYTNSLRNYLIAHNYGVDESQLENFKVTIASRPALDDLNDGKGRIVAYRKDKQFVRLDIPYMMKHYITLPNIEKMSYTSAFVGQVSAIQMPYNDNAASLGVVTYWDFSK